MMKSFRKFVAVGAVTLVGITSLGVGVIFAASNTNGTRPNSMSGIVNAIAQKFNLKAADVQRVIDEQHAGQQKDLQVKQVAMQKTRLDVAVKNGKITQAQEDLIIVKYADMNAFTDSLKDKSAADRQAAIKTQMNALKQWANDSTIPEQYVLFGRGGMGPGMAPRGTGKGMGGFGAHGAGKGCDHISDSLPKSLFRNKGALRPPCLATSFIFLQ